MFIKYRSDLKRTGEEKDSSDKSCSVTDIRRPYIYMSAEEELPERRQQKGREKAFIKGKVYSLGDILNGGKDLKSRCGAKEGIVKKDGSETISVKAEKIKTLKAAHNEETDHVSSFGDITSYESDYRKEYKCRKSGKYTVNHRFEAEREDMEIVSSFGNITSGKKYKGRRYAVNKGTDTGAEKEHVSSFGNMTFDGKRDKRTAHCDGQTEKYDGGEVSENNTYKIKQSGKYRGKYQKYGKNFRSGSVCADDAVSSFGSVGFPEGKSRSTQKDREKDETGRSVSHAFSKMVDLLTRREYSQSELRSKLGSCYDPDIIEEALQRCISYNYQSDERHAEMIVRHVINSHYGPQKLFVYGQKYRADTELLHAAAAGTDWDESAFAALKGRYTKESLADRKVYLKAAAYLVRRGFSSESAFAAVRRMRNEEEDL